MASNRPLPSSSEISGNIKALFEKQNHLVDMGDFQQAFQLQAQIDDLEAKFLSVKKAEQDIEARESAVPIPGVADNGAQMSWVLGLIKSFETEAESKISSYTLQHALLKSKLDHVIQGTRSASEELNLALRKSLILEGATLQSEIATLDLDHGEFLKSSAQQLSSLRSILADLKHEETLFLQLSDLNSRYAAAHASHNLDDLRLSQSARNSLLTKAEPLRAKISRNISSLAEAQFFYFRSLR
jgi:hypothetical protein